MSKSRMPLYLGLTAAGAGGYYLYRAGGDVQGAKKEMKGVFSSFPYLLCWEWVIVRSETETDAVIDSRR